MDADMLLRLLTRIDVVIAIVVTIGCVCFRMHEKMSKFLDQNVIWILFGKVQQTEKHGGTLVAKCLKAHGVEFVFTLVGGHISPILVASKQLGIRVVDVRHEATAVFAADAVARLSGKPGVAAVTAGPGLANTICAVKNAQMAQSPLIVISGAAATLLKGRGSLQDIDQLSVMRSLCKYCASVTRVKDIVPTLKRAFAEAASGVPGPVFVEFPIDVLYNVAEISANMKLLDRTRARDVKDEDLHRMWMPVEASGKTKKEYVDHLRKTRPKAPVFLELSERGRKKQGWVVDAYLRLQRRRLFADAFAPVDFSPLPVNWPAVPKSAVRTTSKKLDSAKRPVCVIQSQALIRGPKYAEKLAAALVDLEIPCFLGGMARGLLPLNSKALYIRQGRTKALKKADVVILVGCMVDFRLQYGKSLPRKAFIVTANRSKEDLTKNTDLFWKPNISAQCDPCDFVLELAKMRKTKSGTSGWPVWLAELKQAEAARDASNRKRAEADAVGHGSQKGRSLLNPLGLCFAADELLGSNSIGDEHDGGASKTPSILIGDGGDFVACAAYTMRPRGALSWLDPGPFGTLGVGGGFALGAKLCRPEADVWLIYGDGSAGYSIAEFDTFKRHNLPIIALIGNDACWTQILREQEPILGDDVACQLEYTPYDVVAKGYGGEGFEIDGSMRSPKAIKEVLQKALAVSRKKKIPVCINAHIGETDFREGSISV